MGSTCPKCGLSLVNGKCYNAACDNFDRYPRVRIRNTINNDGLSLEEGNDFA